jgi:hypothetical protein
VKTTYFSQPGLIVALPPDVFDENVYISIDYQRRLHYHFSVRANALKWQSAAEASPRVASRATLHPFDVSAGQYINRFSEKEIE